MNLEESIAHSENALVSRLRSAQSGIDDRTGKGSAAEEIVEEVLIEPYLLPGFACTKGAVVQGTDPSKQSPAIDRIIYDGRVGAPLVLHKPHSVLPYEIVLGALEITMHLDSRKLRSDMEKIAVIRKMNTRSYIQSVAGSATQVEGIRETDGVGVRSFVVGLPSDDAWRPETIAESFFQIQKELGVHIHVLYVLGIGLFRRLTAERGQPDPCRVDMWTSSDRMFRFANEFYLSQSRWRQLPPGRSVYYGQYLLGEPRAWEDPRKETSEPRPT